jgi:Holliday junction resolvase RusA-like endonuclease
MSYTHEFIFKIRPRGKESVRGGLHNYHIPPKTRNYMNDIGWQAKSQYKGLPLKGPLRISVLYMFKPFKSWSKDKKEKALNGALRHTATPDLDNLMKALKDSLNAIVWKDDKQICSYGCIDKCYGLEDSIELHVEEI